MRSLKRLALGGLLTWSFLCGAAAVNVLLQPNATPESRRGILVASAVLGSLGLAGSGVVVGSLGDDRDRQTQQQLQQAFAFQLRHGDGQIALMPFSLAARVPAAEARAFLDEQIRQFDGEFAVTEQGEVLYSFRRSLARSLKSAQG